MIECAQCGERLLCRNGRNTSTSAACGLWECGGDYAFETTAYFGLRGVISSLMAVACSLIKRTLVHQIS
jgi:hypothetical protein